MIMQELSAEEIRNEVQEIAQEHLSLKVEGYICTTEMVYDILLKAASEGISIAAACGDLENVASGNTIREQLNEQLSIEQLKEHEKEINQALAARLPQQISQSRLEAAIDEHDEPYYGHNEELLDVTCRGKANRGTTHFFRIATAYVFYRQIRLTLAVTFVLPEDSKLDVVKRLHERLLTLKLRIGVLYMDRGFCCGSVITYLQNVKQPTLLACPIRGKKGGTRKLCGKRKSYRTPYTFTDGTTVEMAVIAKMIPGKDKKRHQKWFLYVLIHLDWPLHTIFRRYRSRFGIESSYRILRQAHIKTTSRNPALRFFLLGFALLLVNLWAFFRWFIARIPGLGPHRIDPTHFPFHSFLAFLRRFVENLYETPMSISSPPPAKS